MSIVAGAVIAASLSVLGFAAVQQVAQLARRYEEEYQRAAASALDAMHVSADGRLAWRASLVVAVLAGLIGLLVSRGWLLPTALAAGGALLPIGVLRAIVQARARAFREQLPEVVAQTRLGVACGYSVPMALAMAQRQLPAPAAQELKLAQGHLRLGLPLSEALGRLARRMPGEDIDLFASALALGERAGGQLTQVLTDVEQVVRERLRLERKLRAMTARGRMEALIVAAVPPGLGVAMWMTSPPLMEGFLRHPVGIPSLIGAAIWMGIGFLVIRRILTPEF